MRKSYARLAPHYDRRWSHYVGATVSRTLRRLDVRLGDRVLDVGCGTGVLLDSLTKAFPKVAAFGVDISPEMLAMAGGKLESAPLVAGCVESLPFASESFEIVVSVSSFHYWHDPLQGLAEIRRVLRPDGRLVLTDWCDDFFACKICDLALRWLDPAHRRSYGSKECRRLLAQAGFEILTVERFKIDWMWGLMTATTRRLAEQG